ncbi:guanylate kinase [Ruminococcaceae bacterium OttesenSCG-928-L11]|nr:guanylate kinase [Ruminococcaceae bacterium OttesenSCG-928-L11]
MTEKGSLIVLSGPSGVGKDTVLKLFLERYPDCALSVSATTRAPRPGEIDGTDYFFISRQRFMELVEAGEMLEYAEYNGNCYGTPKAAVEARRTAGQHVILEIEVQGAMALKQRGEQAVFIFLMPPNWQTLRHRLEKRGTEAPEVIGNRLCIARDEIGQAPEYDYIVVNDDLDRCTDQLHAVIAAAGCRTENMSAFIQEVIEDAQAIDVSDH